MKHIKESIVEILKKLVSVSFWRSCISSFIHLVPFLARFFISLFLFFLLLAFFIFGKLFGVFERLPFIGVVFRKIRLWWEKHVAHHLGKLIHRIERTRSSEVKRSYLISIGYKNLMAKKARTAITILGMSVGVGIIVLLLSLGYGVERLIISQVASLDELKVIDVTTGQNTALRLNQDAYDRIAKMEDVEKIMPLVSFVGRVSYNNAQADVLAYSAANEYWELSNIQVIRGKLFANNGKHQAYGGQAVAGASTHLEDGVYGKAVHEKIVAFTIPPQQSAYVWASCTTSSQILGMVSRIEGGFKGMWVWGGAYNGTRDAQGYDKGSKMYLSKWMKATVPLYNKTADDTLIPVLDDTGRQKWQEGCIQGNEVSEDTDVIPPLQKVLGDATTSAVLASTQPATGSSSALPTFEAAVIATDESGMEVVSLEAGTNTKKAEETIGFANHSKEAVVSTGLLKLFNIPLDKAMKTPFTVSFILSKALMPTIEGKAKTMSVPYKIVGVIEDDETPLLYIPFSDIQKLQINNYSQIKVVMSDIDTLPKVRKQIETLGFRTSSTADTVEQIESLFANLRLILVLVGMVALAVASLGMFNTLTVSLLERTREIGGMKTMGMVSDEVQDLFLAEAMIMGMAGGIGGLLLGFLIGKLLSFIVSLIAFTNGQGYLELTYIPPFLILFIIISSFIVGIITGIYPAQRAKKISALNALRYE